MESCLLPYTHRARTAHSRQPDWSLGRRRTMGREAAGGKRCLSIIPLSRSFEKRRDGGEKRTLPSFSRKEIRGGNSYSQVFADWYSFVDWYFTVSVLRARCSP